MNNMLLFAYCCNFDSIEPCRSMTGIILHLKIKTTNYVHDVCVTNMFVYKYTASLIIIRHTFDFTPHKCKANLQVVAKHIGRWLIQVLRYMQGNSCVIQIERTIPLLQPSSQQYCHHCLDGPVSGPVSGRWSSLSPQWIKCVRVTL